MSKKQKISEEIDLVYMMYVYIKRSATELNGLIEALEAFKPWEKGRNK